VSQIATSGSGCLHVAGLEVEALYGGFAAESFTSDSTGHVFVADREGRAKLALAESARELIASVYGYGEAGLFVTLLNLGLADHHDCPFPAAGCRCGQPTLQCGTR
jgi:hypothetical protein